MNRVFIGLMLMCLGPAAPVPSAAESKWDDIRAWFKNFKQGLESSGVESHYKSRTRVTAVAAVRGRPQKLDDPGRPYIKGRLDAKRAEELKRQRAEIQKAVDLVLAGKLDEATQKLDEFEKARPDHFFRRDVNEARRRILDLKEEPSPAAP